MVGLICPSDLIGIGLLYLTKRKLAGDQYIYSYTFRRSPLDPTGTNWHTYLEGFHYQASETGLNHSEKIRNKQASNHCIEKIHLTISTFDNLFILSIKNNSISKLNWNLQFDKYLKQFHEHQRLVSIFLIC